MSINGIRIDYGTIQSAGDLHATVSREINELLESYGRGVRTNMDAHWEGDSASNFTRAEAHFQTLANELVAAYIQYARVAANNAEGFAGMDKKMAGIIYSG